LAFQSVPPFLPFDLINSSINALISFLAIIALFASFLRRSPMAFQSLPYSTMASACLSLDSTLLLKRFGGIFFKESEEYCLSC